MARKKQPPARSSTFVEQRLDQLHGAFEKQAGQFRHLMEHGGGVNNVWMLDTLRSLQMLYLQISAHHDARRSLRIELGEEKV